VSGFDDTYGEGSLEELAGELAAVGYERVVITEHEQLTPHLVIEWTGYEGRNARVVVRFAGSEWTYGSFEVYPGGEGNFTRLALRFCDAAEARGVERFSAPYLNGGVVGVLAHHGWEFEQGGASTTPAGLRQAIHS
jgi:hypothetical protein